MGKKGRTCEDTGKMAICKPKKEALEVIYPADNLPQTSNL